jgi:hypothetical protein
MPRWTRKELVVTCAYNSEPEVGGGWDIVSRTLALSDKGAIFGFVEVRCDDPTDPAFLLRKLARQSKAISSLRRELAGVAQGKRHITTAFP